MLKVLRRSLPDLRAQLDRAVEAMARPLLVSQEPDESSGGEVALRQPYRYLLEQGARVSLLVVSDDPAGGMWRDPIGDLADRTFDSRRDARAATSGYILFPTRGDPSYIRRDIWDRQLDIEAIIARLGLDIPLPPRVKEPPAGKKRRAKADKPAAEDDYEPTQPNARRHRPGPRKPAPPPGHRARPAVEPDADEDDERTPPPAPPEADPFATLGIKAGASEDEVVKAFRALIVQYHPDKVAHLAPEFRALAERRTLELTDAYDKARKRARGE